MRSCKPRNSVIPGHDLGGGNGMHANAIPGAVWMSRRRVSCLIQLDHSPFWPIGVHSGHVGTRRCSWVCAGMQTNPQDRSGGLSDRPGVPTERLSRHISIGIDSSDTKGYYGSVLKRSSYIYSISISVCMRLTRRSRSARSTRVRRTTTLRLRLQRAGIERYA